MKLSYKPFRVCVIPGCHLLTRTYPMCKYHKYKLDKYGDPEYVRPKKTS